MAWQEGEQTRRLVQAMLSSEAAGKLNPAAVMETCEICNGPLMERGHVNGLGILECLACKLPYVRGAITRLAVTREMRPAKAPRQKAKKTSKKTASNGGGG